MNDGLYNGLILAGIIQGLLFSAIILFSKKHITKSSRYLALLILVFSLANLQFSLEEMGAISDDFLYDVIHIPWSVLVPPFLLFYGLTFLYPERAITQKQKLLYLPFILMVVVSTIYKLLVAFGSSDPEFTERLYTVPDLGDIYGEFLNTIFLFVVIVFLLIRSVKYDKEYIAEKVKVPLTWFKITLLVLLVLNCFWFFETFQYAVSVETVFYPLYTAVSITIYWLGYVGIYKIGIREERTMIRKYSVKHSITTQSDTGHNEYLKQMEHLLVNDRMFLDSTITLERIAVALNISKGHLSRTISTELATGFSDYVNKLRVEEAKLFLQNPDFQNYTLVAIGLEAGFNSKSTFYSTFKKFTGITPLQFQKKQLN